MPTVHTSREFDADLQELRARALAMGEHCERITHTAFQAFWQANGALTAEVRHLETQLDQDEVDIQALALRIIALRQPVAGDLRFLAAALRLITDLERVGDEASNITECATDVCDMARLLVDSDLCQMDEEVQAMLHGALRAFVERDPDGARAILARDDSVDGHCATIIAKMETYIASHPTDVNTGIRVMTVAKALERIADHATNVGEEVIFMVRGEDVRHGAMSDES